MIWLSFYPKSCVKHSNSASDEQINGMSAWNEPLCAGRSDKFGCLGVPSDNFNY